jgi:DNA modification methylase
MTIICGDCLDEMRKMEENSISAIVTDSPYGLSFMGKKWDHAVPGIEYWKSCLRIVKPGGFLLAMGGTRTYHRLAVAIEDAGWEIRDCLMYLYGSGFPKSHNFGCKCTGAPVPYNHVQGTVESHSNLPSMQERIQDSSLLVQEKKESSLQLLMSGHSSSLSSRMDGAHEKDCIEQQREEMPFKGNETRKESSMEGRNNLQEKQGELHRPEICEMSSGIPSNGTERRVCDGTPTDNGEAFGKNPSEGGGGSLQGSQYSKQQHRKSRVTSRQQDSQNCRVATCERCTGLKDYKGFGTALKPSHEPIIMAMKPLDGTFKQNAEKWGQAGININESRLSSHSYSQKEWTNRGLSRTFRNTYSHKPSDSLLPKGRWPANVIFDEEAASCIGESSRFFCIVKKDESDCTGVGEKDLKSRVFYCAKASPSERKEGLDCYITVKYDIDKKRNLCLEENMAAVELLKRDIYGLTEHLNIDVFGENITVQFHKDSSSIIKMKIKQIIESKTLNLSTLSPTNEFIRDVENWMEIGSSRAVGAELKKLFQLLITNGKMVSALGVSNAALKMLSIINDEGNWKEKNSTHPTVKPLKLMEYLIKLVMPPKDGILLDPFAGSGTTILAAHKLGISAIGIEKEPEYAEIAQERLNHVIKSQQTDLFQSCI